MPSHIEIAGISGTFGAPVTHSFLEIARITGNFLPPGGNHSFLEIAGISGSFSSTVHSHLEIAQITGSFALQTLLQARAGNDQIVPGVAPRILDGTGSTGPYTIATWTQLSGPTQILDGFGAVVVYSPIPAEIGYQVTFQLDVTDGISHSLDTVTDTVRAWQFWRFEAGGVLVPEIEYDL